MKLAQHINDRATGTVRNVLRRPQLFCLVLRLVRGTLEANCNELPRNRLVATLTLLKYNENRNFDVHNAEKEE